MIANHSVVNSACRFESCTLRLLTTINLGKGLPEAVEKVRMELYKCSDKINFEHSNSLRCYEPTCPSGKGSGLENRLSAMACGFKSYRWRFGTLIIEYWWLK